MKPTPEDVTAGLAKVVGRAVTMKDGSKKKLQAACAKCGMQLCTSDIDREICPSCGVIDPLDGVLFKVVDAE